MREVRERCKKGAENSSAFADAGASECQKRLASLLLQATNEWLPLVSATVYQKFPTVYYRRHRCLRGGSPRDNSRVASSGEVLKIGYTESIEEKDSLLRSSVNLFWNHKYSDCELRCNNSVHSCILADPVPWEFFRGYVGVLSVVTHLMSNTLGFVFEWTINC